jgi:hypothetical protein
MQTSWWWSVYQHHKPHKIDTIKKGDLGYKTLNPYGGRLGRVNLVRVDGGTVRKADGR